MRQVSGSSAGSSDLVTPQIKDALRDALGDGIYLGLLLNDFAIWQVELSVQPRLPL